MKKVKFLLLPAIALALASCSNDEPGQRGDSGENVAPNISANIGWLSRAAGTEWDAGDQIGIYAHGEGLTRYENIAYETAGDGIFSPVGGIQNGIFFQDARIVRFYAYYPFCTDVSESDPIIKDFTTDQSRQKQFDFLAAPSYETTIANPNVRFSFQHKMSRLILHISPDENTGLSVSDDAFQNAGFRIRGIRLDGEFNTLSGEAYATGDPYKDWNISPVVLHGDDSLSFDFIIFPQDDADFVLEMKIADVLYSCNIKADFKAGKSYSYNIVVMKTGASSSDCVVSSAEIMDWEVEPENLGSATNNDSFDIVINGHNAVKMRDGSDSKGALYFATCNIGAERPEDTGLYFWWGDTDGHPMDAFDFLWTNEEVYPNGISAEDLIAEGFLYPNLTLSSSYDAAYKQWGNRWHIPSYDDLLWLSDSENCTWTWTTVNGMNGYLVQSKQTQGMIFLPANGAYSKVPDHESVGSFGFYWTTLSQMNPPGTDEIVSNNRYATFLHFYEGLIELHTTPACNGLGIRPVAYY